jgi:hypothetical protein
VPGRILDAAPAARTRSMYSRAFVAGGALLCAASRLLAASESFELFPPSVPSSEYFREDAGSRELSAGIAEPAGDPPAPGALPYWERPSAAVDAEAFRPIPPGGKPPRDLFDKRTLLSSGAVHFLTAVYASTGAINYGSQAFHFYSEHWYGPNTYAGGADKTSHFIISASLARELALLYDGWGHTREQSIALAFGVTVLSGFLVEVGDGFSPYGFSWEDLTSDILGATTGLVLTKYGLNDLIGLRVGKVPTHVPAPEADEYLGSGYSTEIYSADLKISGLARRMRFDPGIARFLLTSVTYQTKGYGYVPPIPDRQRLVGFELGLNIPEILSAAGVPATTWWGSALYKIFTFFRVPYTSFGWRYDLNHKKWHGPDNGDKYYGTGAATP